MKIQILSDLHLEFADMAINHSAADVVILAGDIHVGQKGVEWAINAIPDKPVLYVLGNHEYYGHIYPTLINTLKAVAANTNVHVLENDMITINDVSFYGCTLWTDLNLYGNARLVGMQCEQMLADFRKIRTAPRYSRLRSFDVERIHAASKTWLETSYNKNSPKSVVITHHAPSTLSIHPRFEDELLSACFASKLDDLVTALSPKLWIHGHMHDSFDYTIGATRVICNPRGYPMEKEMGFNPTLIVEI